MNDLRRTDGSLSGSAKYTNQPRHRTTNDKRKGSTMKKLDIRSAVIGALVAVVITLSVAAATGSRTAWDYRVVSGSVFQDKLGQAINSSVAEGWEFVSASGPNNENWGIAVMRRIHERGSPARPEPERGSDNQ